MQCSRLFRLAHGERRGRGVPQVLRGKSMWNGTELCRRRRLRARGSVAIIGIEGQRASCTSLCSTHNIQKADLGRNRIGMTSGARSAGDVRADCGEGS